MGTTTWTDESVKFLRDNWGKLSGTQIGELLGISRSAVIGKVHRMGLYKRKRRPRVSKPVVKPPAANDMAHKLIEVRNSYQVPEPGDEGRAFGPRTSTLELTHKTCRWPIGHPGTADFFFCGAIPVRGAPYCTRHCAIAWPRRASA